MLTIKRFSTLPKELLAALVDLYQEAYRDDPTYAYRERKRIKSYLKWLLRHARGGFWVAFEKEKPVGFLALEEMPQAPEIHEIVVLPEFKGQHLAEKLMAEALSYLQAKGYPRVALWVGEHNLRAQRFYEKFGFKKIGKDGIWIRMEKNLQEKDLTSSHKTAKASSTSEREMVSSGV